MEKAVHPADSYGNSRVVYKYLSYTFICFQALKSQQKHKVIQHPAGPAPVNVFIFPAVRESRREEKVTERKWLLRNPNIRRNLCLLLHVTRRQTRGHFVEWWTGENISECKDRDVSMALMLNHNKFYFVQEFTCVAVWIFFPILLSGKV